MTRAGRVAGITTPGSRGRLPPRGYTARRWALCGLYPSAGEFVWQFYAVGAYVWDQATGDRLHDRYSIDRARRRRDRRDDRLRLALRACVAMAELILGGGVAAFLLIYLIWALVRPEDL